MIVKTILQFSMTHHVIAFEIQKKKLLNVEFQVRLQKLMHFNLKQI
jgi:hypothetical protein